MKKIALFIFLFVMGSDPRLMMGFDLHSMNGKAALRANRDYALFFAVDDYAPDSGFEDLRKSISNAEAIAAELHGHYGFETEVVRNPTLDQIAEKLSEYQSHFAQNPEGRYPSTGQLLIYFTGHGVSEDKSGYFVPSDGNLKKLYSTALSYDTWRPKINSIDCRHILVAIDACYSVTFDPDWLNRKKDPNDFKRTRPGELSAGEKLLLNNESDKHKCRILFTSDGSENKVPEESTFAQNFLEGLQHGQRKDGILPSHMLAGQLAFSSPTPRLTSFGDDEKGSFLFVSISDANPIDPERLNEMEKDRAAWQKAKEANIISVYQNYLKNFPNGDYREQAEGKIKLLENDLKIKKDELAWDQTVEKNKPELYHKYLEDFPDGQHAAEAKAYLESSNEGMVRIGGGTFQMGNAKGEPDEQPEHKVSISSFYLARSEVTVAEFKTFVDARAYKTDAERAGWAYGWNGKQWVKMNGVNWRHDAQGKLRAQNDYNHPVIFVSWNDAQEYCKWLSKKNGQPYRLPTEAEWEYAAGNGNRHTRYAWGESMPAATGGGNVCDETARRAYSDWSIFDGYEDGFIFTSPVRSFPPNELGLCDITGNVAEWCSDWYGPYAPDARNDPAGPGSGSLRVVRGGSWNDAPLDCRTTCRSGDLPDAGRAYVGFRIAKPITQ